VWPPAYCGCCPFVDLLGPPGSYALSLRIVNFAHYALMARPSALADPPAILGGRAGPPANRGTPCVPPCQQQGTPASTESYGRLAASSAVVEVCGRRAAVGGFSAAGLTLV